MMSEIKTLPIIFSDAMVKALLEGRKTQTRRIPTPMWDKAYQNVKEGGKLALYVRECFSVQFSGGFKSHDAEEANYHIEYRTGGPELDLRWTGRPGDYDPYADMYDRQIGEYRPSIHMPRWASRITLEVTDIWRERLHSIGWVSAQCEGVFFKDYGRECFHGGNLSDVGNCPAPEKNHPKREGWSWKNTTSHEQCHNTARFAFAELWDSLHGRKPGEAWDDDPEVYALSFKVHRCNVADFVMEAAA